MKLSTALECMTDLPEDQIEDGEEIIQLGGQGVALEISNLLNGEGINTSPPTLDPEHGWEFIAAKGRHKYWILVTDLDDKKLIQTKDISPVVLRLASGNDKYSSFLEILHRVLSCDSRFSSVRWWSPA